MAIYRAAVIGTGRMGSTFDDEMTQGGGIFTPYCHGPAYFYSPLTELVSGADIHEEQRSLFGERWGLSRDHLYADYREMLKKEKPDIVSVTTTAKVRSRIVVDMARSGVKAIWAEKPIALSLEEADRMVRVCQEEGVTLAVNCARRWNPFYSEGRRMIEAGELGDVLQVTGYGQCGLSHNGSHLLDIMRYMAGGNVQWVFGEMESNEAAAGDNDLMGNGYLAYDNGARGFVRSTPVGSTASWEIDVICERGRLICRESPPEWTVVREEAGEAPGAGSRRRRQGLPVRYPIPWPARMQGTGLTIIEDVVSAIETGRPPKCSGDDGLAALETAIALRESHRRGGVKVHLPLKDRSLLVHSTETLHGDTPVRVRRQLQATS